MLTLPSWLPRAKVRWGSSIHFYLNDKEFWIFNFKCVGHSWTLSFLLISPWDWKMTIESTFGGDCMVKHFLFCLLYKCREKKSNVKIGSRKRKERSYCCPFTHNALNISWNFVILYSLFFLIWLNCVEHSNAY